MEQYLKQSRPHTRALRALLLFGALVATSPLPVTYAQDNGDSESTRLAALLRQLDLADDLVQRASDSGQLSTARFRFDYARLHTDLARIRKGIEDYLTPHRAQPRDPAGIEGAYRTSAESP